MSWKGANLEEILRKGQRRYEKKHGDDVLKMFRQVLTDDDKLDDQVLANIFGEAAAANQLRAEQLDAENIFHLDQIKKLCTDYRLRFLDSSHFKGEIPYEAISKIKKLQREHSQEITQFKILAPAPMFHLEYKDKDPLLFVALGRDRYYLVHKWGNDLHPLRRLAVFPFRNFPSLLATVFAVALSVVMAIPDSVYMGPNDESAGAIKVIFFFYLFIALSALTVLYGFSRMKNFSSRLWDSKYKD